MDLLKRESILFCDVQVYSFTWIIDHDDDLDFGLVLPQLRNQRQEDRATQTLSCLLSISCQTVSSIAPLFAFLCLLRSVAHERRMSGARAA